VQSYDPTAAAPHGQRMIGRDPEQPGAEGALVAKLPAPLECGEQGLDDDVFRVRPIPQDEIGDGLYLPAVQREHVLERLRAAPPKSVDGQRVPFVPAGRTWVRRFGG